MDRINSITENTDTHIHPLIMHTHTSSHIYTNAHGSQDVYISAGYAASAEHGASCINDLSASYSLPRGQRILDLHIQQHFRFERRCCAKLGGGCCYKTALWKVNAMPKRICVFVCVCCLLDPIAFIYGLHWSLSAPF